MCKGKFQRYLLILTESLRQFVKKICSWLETLDAGLLIYFWVKPLMPLRHPKEPIRCNVYNLFQIDDKLSQEKREFLIVSSLGIIRQYMQRDYSVSDTCWVTNKWKHLYQKFYSLQCRAVVNYSREGLYSWPLNNFRDGVTTTLHA